MSYYIIIRGPLACGKTTISKELAKKLNADYISIDEILDKNNLTKDKEDGYISQKSFLKANEIAIVQAKKSLEKNKPIIFEGNFYWKSQIEDLIKRLDLKHYIFTLKATLELCIQRDKLRGETHGALAAMVVHKKTSSFDYGFLIDLDKKTLNETVKQIINLINKN